MGVVARALEQAKIKYGLPVICREYTVLHLFIFQHYDLWSQN